MITTIKDKKDHQIFDGIRHSVCQLNRSCPLVMFSLAKISEMNHIQIYLSIFL